MKLKKLVSALVSGAMILGTLSIPAFAVEPLEEPVADEVLETSGDIELFSAADSWIDNADTTWYNDTDTEFTLTTAAQLAGLAKLVNAGNTFNKKIVKLGADINLAGKNWTPIGYWDTTTNTSYSFNGIFDGNSCTVSNMVINMPDMDSIGFIGQTGGSAKVINLTLSNVDVYGQFDVAAVVGNGNCIVNNVHVNGVVKVLGWVQIGGIVGYGYPTVSDCSVIADVDSGSYIKVDSRPAYYYSQLGGIVGFTGEGNITTKNCTVANLTISGVTSTGGITGNMHYGNVIENCSVNNCKINITSTSFMSKMQVGSIAGRTVNGASITIKNCSVDENTVVSDADGNILKRIVPPIAYNYRVPNNIGMIVNGSNYQIGDAETGFAAANDGDTVYLYQNFDTVSIALNNCITIDTNGYELPQITSTPDKTYLKNNGDGTYTVTLSPSTVVDSDKTISAEVKLDDLKNNTAIDHEPDAVYSVVVSSAPEDEEKKIETVAASDNTNTLDIMDIKVKKTVDGESEYVNNVAAQKVTITLQSNATSKPKVYYIDIVNGVKTANEVTPVEWSSDAPNVVSFIAPHFSTYAVSYNAAAPDPTKITPNVSVVFEKVTDNEYDILLKADNDKVINRFMAADLTFAYTPATENPGTVSYTITPENKVNLISKENGRYEFNLDGLNAYAATGATIKIGTVTFEGYGKGTFKVEDAATNIVNTAKLESDGTDNNIVSYYVPGGGTDVGKLVTNTDIDTTYKGTIDVALTAPKKTLTVNIAYNNKINNNAAAYQDMTVTVSGGDLSNPIEIALGDYTGVAQNPYNVTFTENADKSTSYSLTVADTLTKNTAYTVTVEGLGYRTARHTVTMTADKTLNFWNNVKTTGENIEAGVTEDTTKVTKNFLAGDIVKDNNINIYDLSAVVSYFGTSNDVNAASAYARYDLNRDGKIDSKDVAYVLVSWGK